jgi:hypothetical protein
MNMILEVAIGLAFVFLLFSLLVSAINEAIFGHLTHLRSRVLEDSLHAILSKQARGFSLWAWIRKGLGYIRRGFKPAPSVASNIFSEHLLDHPLVQGLAVTGRRCPSYLPAETFVDATIGTLLGLGTAPSSPPSSPGPITVSISDLSEAVDHLSDEHARRIFSSVLAGSADLQEARTRLESWFNNSMERVSGAYRRYSQFWLYIWATLIVIWLNVDTIEITRRLLADSQFRGALVAGAIKFQKDVGQTNAASDQLNVSRAATNTQVSMAPGEILEQIGKLNLPIGWGACTNGMAKNSLIGGVMMLLPRLELVVGTNSAAYSLVNGALAPSAPCPATPEAWRLKLLGLLITVAAISQGAPFWFDLLNRVTNVRSTGRPPQRKTDNT